jgi:hypothetical protein
MEKDLKGTGHGVIEIVSCYFPEGLRKTRGNLRIAAFRAEIPTEHIN